MLVSRNHIFLLLNRHVEHERLWGTFAFLYSQISAYLCCIGYLGQYEIMIEKAVTKCLAVDDNSHLNRLVAFYQEIRSCLYVNWYYSLRSRIYVYTSALDRIVWYGK